MNLNDFRTRAARVSGMTNSGDDQTLLDSWANESITQFLRDTKIHVRKAALAVTAGSAVYELDSDILSFTDIWMEPSNGNQSSFLEPIDSAELTRRQIVQSSAGATPMYYSPLGVNLIELHPAPLTTGDELHIKYVPRPSSTMSATADTPSATAYGGIPSEFHPTLESYVKWKACEAEEHKPSKNGLQFQAEYERGVAKVRADMTKKSGVMKARARWGHRRSFPVTPGTDTG